MTLPTIDQARSWRGLTLVAADNEPVGRIEAIYVDRTTRQPEWALVDTGLFGSARTFVPLADAAQYGDVVRVPHETSTVRGAPRLDQDADLSEEDEARLYAHYGIQYTTEQSPSGLPAGATASPDGGMAAAATDATAELGQTPTRLQADAPTPASTAAGTTPTAASVPGDGDANGTGGGRRKQAAAGIGAVALAAIAAGLAELRRRRRRPPSLGERVGQASREAVDALTQAAEKLRRQAVAAASGEGARKAAKSGRRAARKASRAGQEAAGAGRRAAQVAVAGGLAAAESSRRAARKAAKTGHEASEESRRAARKAARKAAKTGHEAAEGGRRAARKAAASGAAAAAEGRRAAKRASKEAAAVIAAIETTPESKRKARKRAQARKRAAAATAAAARSVAAAPAAAGRRVQKLDAGQRTRKVIPRRRRRSKMKMMGKLGMVVGAAVGYVLGAKAGRERYDQLAASARQLLDKPQVKRVVDSAPGDLGARLEQVANKAADKVHEAGDKVASSGSATPGPSTGATTSGATTTTTTPTTPTTTTPTAPSTVGGATTKRSPAASERKTKSS